MRGVIGQSAAAYTMTAMACRLRRMAHVVQHEFGEEGGQRCHMRMLDVVSAMHMQRHLRNTKYPPHLPLVES